MNLDVQLRYIVLNAIRRGVLLRDSKTQLIVCERLCIGANLDGNFYLSLTCGKLNRCRNGEYRSYLKLLQGYSEGATGIGTTNLDVEARSSQVESLMSLINKIYIVAASGLTRRVAVVIATRSEAKACQSHCGEQKNLIDLHNF